MNLNEFFSIFSKFKTYLEDILKRKEKIDHRTIIRWSNQILIGIEYLHEKNIIHGDIRPE
jgi:serine/threonine protein kinase